MIAFSVFLHQCFTLFTPTLMAKHPCPRSVRRRCGTIKSSTVACENALQLNSVHSPTSPQALSIHVPPKESLKYKIIFSYLSSRAVKSDPEEGGQGFELWSLLCLLPRMSFFLGCMLVSLRCGLCPLELVAFLVSVYYNFDFIFLHKSFPVLQFPAQ